MASRSVTALRSLRRPLLHRLTSRASSSSATAAAHVLFAGKPFHSPSPHVIRSLPSSCASSLLSRHFSSDAEAATSKVVEAKNDAHYDEMFKDIASKETLGVVYFTAQWCGPCKVIAPVIDELSLEFNDVTFIKIDVDKVAVEETMKKSHIGVVPTFHFYKRAKRIGELTGLAEGKLKKVIEQLRSE